MGKQNLHIQRNIDIFLKQRVVLDTPVAQQLHHLRLQHQTLCYRSLTKAPGAQ